MNVPKSRCPEMDEHSLIQLKGNRLSVTSPFQPPDPRGHHIKTEVVNDGHTGTRSINQRRLKWPMW